MRFVVYLRHQELSASLRLRLIQGKAPIQEVALGFCSFGNTVAHTCYRGDIVRGCPGLPTSAFTGLAALTVVVPELGLAAKATRLSSLGDGSVGKRAS
jgi:hypothetical protein